MMITLRRLATAAIFATAFGTLPAGATVITSAIPESNAQLGTRADTIATIGTFTFTAPGSALADITDISIQLTLEDGDTGSGDFDHGQLHLLLDGFDTGVLLDGFRNNTIDTQINSKASPDLAASIYASLISDGALVAAILDDDDDDVSPNGAGESNSRKNFMRLSRDHSATLTLTGDNALTQASAAPVPEPASWALTGLGLAGMAAVRRRRPR